MTAPDYGVDLRMSADLLDIDPYAREVSGPRLVAERMVRRLITARGTLIGASNDGIDLRQEVNDSQDTRGAAQRLQSAIAAELSKEEAIDDLSVAVTLSGTGASDATVQVSAVGAEGPFSLVLGIPDVTVALLSGP